MQNHKYSSYNYCPSNNLILTIFKGTIKSSIQQNVLLFHFNKYLPSVYDIMDTIDFLKFMKDTNNCMKYNFQKLNVEI